MPGKVIEGHAKLEADCRSCHVLMDKAAQDRLCLDCHKDVAQDVARKQGHHGRIRISNCRACHTEHKGRAANIAPVEEARFDHALTDYSLKGRHVDAQCRACHQAGAKFRSAPGTCIECHRKDDRHKGQLGTACADCHAENSWKETTFDHARTDFPLSGKHAGVQCRSCHKSTAFNQTPQACVACHRKDDKHKARFGDKCQTCHSAKAWDALVFDHDRDTGYALQGKHRQVKCSACHTGVLYRDKLQGKCVSCHRKDDKHRGSLGSACESCHLERGWKETRFDHSTTRFPLLGKHASVACQSCHKSALYKDTPSACVSCHRKDDRHKGTLGEACGSCHAEQSWKEARFDHSRTRFPLEGKHASAKCGECHRQGDPKTTPSACIACHRADDQHRGRLGEKCEACHSARDWKTTRFDHDRDTKYPLRGKHRGAACETCHTQPLHKAKPKTDCVACHAKDDIHQGQEGLRCEQCHQEASWKTSSFDHARSRFPLVGSHLTVACKKCHASARFKDAKSDCAVCHREDDVHRRRLGTQCDTCHNARAWKVWDFDHDRKTRFVLDGSHRELRCDACHTRPVDRRLALAMSCVSCHAAEDVHDGAFGPQCEKCHVTGSFKTVKQRIGGCMRTDADRSARRFCPGGSQARTDAAWIRAALVAER